MQLAVGAASGLVNALLHTKGKLKLVAAGGGGGGGMLDKLGAAAASMSPIPIPGLGAKDPDDELSFMFNPTEYRLSRSVTLNNEPNEAQPGGNSQFLGTGPRTLSMQLFFDDFASAKGDVTPKINKLFKWQMPDATTKAPPKVKLDWGTNDALKNPDFQAVIKDVNVSYTVFNKSGTPIQAKVDITLEEVVGTIAIGKNPTSHALDARRVHVVVEGDTLASIAYSEYGDPNYWRALAETNGIDDPLRVRPGANLLIPSAADAARLA
jgi:nucleoid-associated protein YgaU